MNGPEIKALNNYLNLLRAGSGDAWARNVPASELVDTLNAYIGDAKVAGTHLGVILLAIRPTDRLTAIVGDNTLEQIFDFCLDRIRELLRPSDFVARINHGRILIALPDLTKPQFASVTAHSILKLLDSLLEFSATRIACEQRTGISVYPQHGQDAAALIKAADIALEKSLTVKYRMVQYRPELDRKLNARAKSTFAADLHAAMKRNELELHYQPQLDNFSRRYTSMEALLRWPTFRGGVVDPSRIVLAAEQAGMAKDLTVWIINTAFRHAALMARLKLRLKFAVNLSTANLADLALPAVIARAAVRWHVAPSQLMLECSEGALQQETPASQNVIRRLRDLGVKFVLDDFGVGQSSVVQLRRFPIDSLKIDRAVVQRMNSSKRDAQVVRSMIKLAHEFDLKAYAEGVEDEQTATQLRESGCDGMQGFLYSRALPIDDFVRWYSRTDRATPTPIFKFK